MSNGIPSTCPSEINSLSFSRTDSGNQGNLKKISEGVSEEERRLNRKKSRRYFEVLIPRNSMLCQNKTSSF